MTLVSLFLVFNSETKSQETYVESSFFSRPSCSKHSDCISPYSACCGGQCFKPLERKACTTVGGGASARANEYCCTITSNNNKECCPNRAECCDSVEACCPGFADPATGKHCCFGNKPLCCGGTICCAVDKKCCQNQAECCDTTAQCCPGIIDGTTGKPCCPTGTICVSCHGELLCASGGLVDECPDDASCCFAGDHCCIDGGGNTFCCAPNQKCCSGFGCYSEEEECPSPSSSPTPSESPTIQPAETITPTPTQTTTPISPDPAGAAF